ncbi:hypothetical protein [Horticoccus sp. 23ND18S-11]|uniref:hypothetical protein n=1 Tax=Horticoccus sp. 23ND18S-11 TaxID=3391832 RepID=UPI0039C9409B
MQTASLVKPLLSDEAPRRSVTRRMLDVRTHEIAVRAGRIPPHVTQSDYEQAKRELTGFGDAERQDAVLEQA